MIMMTSPELELFTGTAMHRTSGARPSGESDPERRMTAHLGAPHRSSGTKEGNRTRTTVSILQIAVMMWRGIEGARHRASRRDRSTADARLHNSSARSSAETHGAWTTTDRGTADAHHRNRDPFLNVMKDGERMTADGGEGSKTSRTGRALDRK